MSARPFVLTADLLLRAYRLGMFPMAESRASKALHWLDPEHRGILPLHEFRSNRPETWINLELERLFVELHRLGFAHSVESWKDGRLVGGLYGACMGGAFFGESMFSTETDASKVALVHLVARLRLGGYVLLDTQFITAHLSRFGASEIPRAEYHKLLAEAVEVPARFNANPDLAELQAEITAMRSPEH
jgi:leucyl/phenylalanyl-tRNA--protein transferase